MLEDFRVNVLNLHMAIMEISRSHFKQLQKRIAHYMNLCYGVF